MPLFQSESKCKSILMKMTLICMKMKLNAELIFSLRLVLKTRETRELGNGLLRKVTISRLLLLVNLSNEQSVPVIL